MRRSQHHLAEMALATLNGVEVELNCPHIMELSATPSKSRVPWVHPIMIPCNPFLSATRQGRFREFRPFGPLHMVNLDVDLGFPERGDLLYFWRASDAQAAIKHINAAAGANVVRIINESSLKCTVCEVFGSAFSWYELDCSLLPGLRYPGRCSLHDRAGHSRM
jgi:hypothetical protein